MVEKLAGVFEKEGTAGNMTWSIHQFIITDSGKVLGITIKKTDRGCIVSGIDHNSLSFHHGIKVSDVILGSIGIIVGTKNAREKSQKLGFTDKSYFHELEHHPNSMKEGANIDDMTGKPDPDLLESDIRERMLIKPLILEVICHYKDRDQSDPWQHCDLHKFTIKVKGKLGMEVVEAWRDTQTKYLKLLNVHPNGMANFYGLRNDDILYVPGSDEELMIESVEAV